VDGGVGRVSGDVTGAIVVEAGALARCAVADEHAANSERPVATITTRTARTTSDATVGARGAA
jgi:hypothetical protein